MTVVSLWPPSTPRAAPGTAANTEPESRAALRRVTALANDRKQQIDILNREISRLRHKIETLKEQLDVSRNAEAHILRVFRRRHRAR